MGVVVPGVLCWIEVPLTWPEDFASDIVRPFDDGRVLVADRRGDVAVLDYMTNGPMLGPVVSTSSAEFQHVIRWAVPLQLDADPAIEVMTNDYYGIVLYETMGATVSVTAMGSSPPEGFMLVPIDVDRDGIDELVRAGRGPLAVWRVDPTGTWVQLSDPLPQPPCHALNLAVADFDGDARDDLVVLGNHGYGTHPSHGEELCPNYEEAFDDMYILLNRYEEQGMDSPFELVLGPEVPFETLLQTPHSPTLVPGDFDGDGVTDLFVRPMSQSDIGMTSPWFIRGVGDGRLADPVELPFELGYHAIGDFDGDGSMDVVASSTDEGLPEDLWVWWGSGGSDMSWYPANLEPSLTGSAVRIKVAADMNGDGVSDVLIQSSSQYHLLLSNP